MEKKIKRIGLFDSGIGGLTVLKELLALPCAEYIYIADTANIPYGQKTPEQILHFSQSITQFLISEEIDALVIACHTSSAIALPHLQKKFPHILIIGTIIETMLHATEQTLNGRIGIIATQASINSHLHKKNLLTINPHLEIFEMACPKLVPLIESPIQDVQHIEQALQEYLIPLLENEIDTLILGCTHYPLLTDEIRKIVGDKISLIGSEKTIANELRKYFENVDEKAKQIMFYSTSDSLEFAQKAELILNQEVIAHQLTLNISLQQKSENLVYIYKD